MQIHFVEKRYEEVSDEENYMMRYLAVTVGRSSFGCRIYSLLAARSSSQCKYSQKGGNRRTFVALKRDKAETGPVRQKILNLGFCKKIYAGCYFQRSLFAIEKALQISTATAYRQTDKGPMQKICNNPR